VRVCWRSDEPTEGQILGAVPAVAVIIVARGFATALTGVCRPCLSLHAPHHKQRHRERLAGGTGEARRQAVACGKPTEPDKKRGDAVGCPAAERGVTGPVHVPFLALSRGTGERKLCMGKRKPQLWISSRAVVVARGKRRAVAGLLLGALLQGELGERTGLRECAQRPPRSTGRRMPQVARCVARRQYRAHYCTQPARDRPCH
jgi:hypothetical protein